MGVDILFLLLIAVLFGLSTWIISGIDRLVEK